MRKQNIPFEEVFDLFAIRVTIDSRPEMEKADCWRVYSIVTDFYPPTPDRLRDWISTPKANGYESLHTTIMGPKGKWVEVQIRTRRMHEIAEKGLAAHWKYKEASNDSGLDDWIAGIREQLDGTEQSAMDFLNHFKLNLFSDEVFIFTPNGDLKSPPSGSTALDFAYEIHTDIGEKCLGAKVSNKLVPLSHELKSGDQVEIITSDKQQPKEEWLNYVITAKAKSKINSYFKESKKTIAQKGKKTVLTKFEELDILNNSLNINELLAYLRIPSVVEFYFRVGNNQTDFYF